MALIHNLKILDELDDATALEIIHLAIEELKQILEDEPRTKEGSKNDNSGRRFFEHQRDELQRRLRLLWSKSMSEGGAKKNTKVVVKSPCKKCAALKENEQEEHKTKEASSGPKKVAGKTRGWLYKLLPFLQTTVVHQPSKRVQETPQVENGETSTAVSQTKPAAPTADEAPSNARKETCNVCMEEFFWYLLLTLACGHHFCSPCITELFKGATKDESRYPPRCCEPIPLEQGSTIVQWEVMDEFLKKKVEWDTLAKNRTYCSKTDCGIFILPKNVKIHDKTAKCQKCGTKTCTNCKQEQHPPYTPCHDPGLQGALNLIRANRWQRCSACGTGVERELGCNKIQCVCGRKFCYECGKDFGTCGCPYFPDNFVRNQNEPEIPPDLEDGEDQVQMLAERRRREWMRNERIREDLERVRFNNLLLAQERERQHQDRQIREQKMREQERRFREMMALGNPRVQQWAGWQNQPRQNPFYTGMGPAWDVTQYRSRGWGNGRLM